MDLPRIRALVEPHEGNTAHPYNDTAAPPRVTVGIGCAISLQQALGLPWTIDGRPATPDEIRRDYAAVSALPGGHLAASYAAHTRIRLPAATILSMFAARVGEFQAQLRHIFPALDSYSADRQLALLDMVFQVGAGNLVTHFPHFVAAVRAGDWATAARESHRSESSAQRNADTARLLAGVAS